ncbi:DUF5803 family protein [Natronomonas marina]|uniref:DUF5803 family protein n=1 Tax=Natronomonas marina TaxID=2961939 RepID=UPI0020C95F60|nr:DUF5803 family protein [Natronomonas marina]
MNRRLLAAAAFLVLVGLAGCVTPFGGDAASPSDLSQDATYEFDTDRDAYIVVNENNYTAVYNVSKADSNESIALYTTDSLTVEQPLAIRALQFRYANESRFPNGTVVRYERNATGPRRVYPNGENDSVDTLTVNTTNKRTKIDLPAEEGQLAFTVSKSGKELAIRPPVNGSFELVLPPNTDASLPLLSQVRPPNDGRETVGDRVHLTWEELDTSVLVVRWYLNRDVWLFGGLAAVALLVGLVGTGYYYLQVQQAKKRRQTEGIDVDYEDDGRDPPPGMG